MKCSRSFKTHKLSKHSQKGQATGRVGNVSLEGKGREALRKETEVETVERL